MATIIDEKAKKEIQKNFQRMVNPVRLIYFTQEHECHSCSEQNQLLQELAALSDKLTLQVNDFIADNAAQFKPCQRPLTSQSSGGDSGLTRSIDNGAGSFCSRRCD